MALSARRLQRSDGERDVDADLATACAGWLLCRSRYSPAGFAPYQSVIFGYINDRRGIRLSGGNVVRLRCAREDRAITYRLRVVSRGTYHAEPAIMQS
jgi:hypothetical protein